MKTISTYELKRRLDNEKPRNDTPTAGYALVCVLDADSFLNGHIPDSINITSANEKEFERLFTSEKEIIIYGTIAQCPICAGIGKILTGRGFINVIEYTGGMEDWIRAGNRMELGIKAAYEIRMG